MSSPRYRAHDAFLRETLIPAYAEVGPLAFAYSQGSMVEGLSNASDIDTVCVWLSTIPETQLRLPKGIANLDSPPRRFDRQETFWARGQDLVWRTPPDQS